MKHLLFVYGTLKHGHVRAKYLFGQRYLGVGTLHPRYAMYHLGGCPALVEQNTEEYSVLGELYEVDEDCLEPIDQVEGVSHGLYERKLVDLKEFSLVFLPTDQRVSDYLFSNKCESYIFRKNVEGARRCGPVWCKP